MRIVRKFDRPEFWAAVLILIAVAFFLLVPPAREATGPRGIGAGSFVFRDAKGNEDRPIRVWYYWPEKLGASSPVLFVMHGSGRDGRIPRDNWITHAKRYGFLLLAPEFSEKHYPTRWMYHEGNVFLVPGVQNVESRWTFNAIEHIFDHIRTSVGLTAQTYYIYGHSAGAHFVHRMVIFKPDARFVTAICANAGWYMMPTYHEQYPYGATGSGVRDGKLKSAFASHLIVLLGDEDTDPNPRGLADAVLAQGKHRLARGRKFYATAEAEAAELETPLNWELGIVPGVGHSDRGVAWEAARLLFEDPD